MKTRIIALVLASMGALGCGRSGGDSTEMIQVQLGMASLSGGDLDGAIVSKSLIHFDFSLTRFDQSLTCGREDTCFWTAEGWMPALLAEGLVGYKDASLEVLFADSQQADTDLAALPAR
jgi:hypothetical protein